MAISLVSVGAKITAAIANAVIGQVNAQFSTTIIPTVSGSGVSVGAAGKVTLAAATSAAIKGCFSGTYDNYLVIIDISTQAAAATINFNMSSAGVSDVTSAYQYALLYGVTTTPTAANSGVGTVAPLGPSNSVAFASTITFWAPALTRNTRFTSVSNGTVSTTQSTPGMIAGQIETSTAYDGFTLTSSQAMTGTIRVYGMNVG